MNDELQVAVRNNDVEAVKAAIEEGADVNVHDEEGWTPLMWAALHQSLDMVPWVGCRLQLGLIEKCQEFGRVLNSERGGR